MQVWLESFVLTFVLLFIVIDALGNLPFVISLSVAGAYQRAGLALRMYRKLEHTFRKDGVRMVIADTEVDNEDAIAFFKAMGFALSARHVWLTKTLHQPGKKVDDAGIKPSRQS